MKFSGDEFLETAPKFRKRKKTSSSFVYVLYKTCHQEIHVLVVQWRQRDVPKSVMHLQRCCFGYKTYCSFDVLVAVAVALLKLPSRDFKQRRRRRRRRERNWDLKIHSRFLNKFTMISTHLVCTMWPNYDNLSRSYRGRGGFAFTFSLKPWMCSFHMVVLQRTTKKFTKVYSARAEPVFS